MYLTVTLFLQVTLRRTLGYFARGNGFDSHTAGLCSCRAKAATPDST